MKSCFILIRFFNFCSFFKNKSDTSKSEIVTTYTKAQASPKVVKVFKWETLSAVLSALEATGSWRAEKDTQIGWVSESMVVSESSWLWQANTQLGNSWANITASPSAGGPKHWARVSSGPVLPEIQIAKLPPESPCPWQQCSCMPMAQSRSSSVSVWAALPVLTLDQPPTECVYHWPSSHLHQ